MALNRSNLKGVAFALIGFAAFSTHDAVIKLLGGAYAPFQILFFSVLFGFPLATLMLMSDSSILGSYFHHVALHSSRATTNFHTQTQIISVHILDCYNDQVHLQAVEVKGLSFQLVASSSWTVPNWSLLRVLLFLNYISF